MPIYLDIEIDQLEQLHKELDTTTEEFYAAYSRAAKRTARTLAKLSKKYLKNELGLRTLTELRKRLKNFHLKRSYKKGGDLPELKLWYGLNDLPVSAFKGTPRQTVSGAEFKGHKYEKGFVRKNRRGKKTIFKRAKRGRSLVEQTVPIKDKAEIIIEDEILEQFNQIFWHHFSRDLKARAKYKVGDWS